MSSSADAPAAVGFAFLDARVRTAVERAAAGDPNPGDPLRGLYISDDQALSLAADVDAHDADARLADAAARLGLDALDAAVLGVCAAPELHPRFGRLFAYLHDDVTRRLASPRLVGELLAGEGVAPADVLACFGHAAPLRRSGALRLIEGDGTTARRPRGEGRRPAGGVPARARRAGRPGRRGRLRREPPREPTRPPRDRGADRLAARLARARCRWSSPGPTPRGWSRAPPAAGCCSCDVRELGKPEVMADAALCGALEDRLLCGDGLDALEPAERGQARPRARRAPRPR